VTDLNTVIARALQLNGLVTKAVVIMEVVDNLDMSKKLVVMGSDCPVWDATGMLAVVQADLIDAYVNLDDIGEDDGEE
jgi:hypothetical protein